MNDSQSSTETPVETGLIRCRVLAIHPVFSSKVKALASVELDIDGIVMTIHGIQIVKARNAYGDCLQVKLPAHRMPDGQWETSVTLPGELERPLGDAVLGACREIAETAPCESVAPQI